MVSWDIDHGTSGVSLQSDRKTEAAVVEVVQARVGDVHDAAISVGARIGEARITCHRSGVETTASHTEDAEKAGHYSSEAIIRIIPLSEQADQQFNSSYYLQTLAASDVQMPRHGRCTSLEALPHCERRCKG